MGLPSDSKVGGNNLQACMVVLRNCLASSALISLAISFAVKEYVRPVAVGDMGTKDLGKGKKL